MNLIKFLLQEYVKMEAEKFRNELFKKLQDSIKSLQNEDKDWIIKGFIDTYKNIYTISVDTKVVSKILELMLFPTLSRFATCNGLKIELAKYQNHYPDITFIDPADNKMFAVDIKSTYKINSEKVNGFTLGAFTGYFRNRDSTKNITFAYEKYDKHFVLGVIYKKKEEKNDENKIYKLEDIDSILSVIYDFEFIIQEKYKIANSRTGSGNTKNMGSITDIKKLINGEGSFSTLGEEIFDDYWMYYQTKDMADGDKSPYTNLKEYAAYKQKAPNLELIKDIVEEEPNSNEED